MIRWGVVELLCINLVDRCTYPGCRTISVVDGAPYECMDSVLVEVLQVLYKLPVNNLSISGFLLVEYPGEVKVNLWEYIGIIHGS